MGPGIICRPEKIIIFIFWKQSTVRFRVSDHGLLPKNKNFNFPGRQMMTNANFASYHKNASKSVSAVTVNNLFKFSAQDHIF